MQRSDVQQYYLDVRHLTHALCQPLAIEDYVVQPVASMSPPKWHLAHTTWFFETFILQPYTSGYTPYHPLYSYCLTPITSMWANAGAPQAGRPVAPDSAGRVRLSGGS